MQKWYANVNANVRDKLQRFIHIFAKPTAQKNLFQKQNYALLLFRMHWRDRGNFLRVSENLLPYIIDFLISVVVVEL